MKLRYYSEFKSKKEKAYRIEVHTVLATYSEELALTDSPFAVEYESDTLYKPLKMSNSVTNILTDKILSDLYTAEGQNIEVRLYNKTDNILEWFGYMSPNLYSSDYVTPFNIVELQAVDTISVLENKKYSYIDPSGALMKSFKDIILYVLDIADPGKVLSKLYFQKTNRISKDTATSLIEEIYIHERNFFDEANEPMNSRDVLEEISKYVGMTFIQYQDAYYMIDYNFLKNNELHFFLYDRIDDTCESVTIQSALLNVYNIGVSESAGNISLGDSYNKVSVVANMNRIDNLCPELIDDEKDIVNQNLDHNKYYVSDMDLNGEVQTLLTAFFTSKDNWDYSQQRNINWDQYPPIVTKIDELSIANIDSCTNGTFIQKCYSYTKKDGDPSSLDWKTYLTFLDTYYKYYRSTMLKLTKKNYLVVKGGYFLINMTFKLSKNKLAHSIISQSDTNYLNVKYHHQYGWKYEPTLIPCKLQLGDLYYNGEKWCNIEEVRLKRERNYYEEALEYGFGVYDETLYYYIDEYGYQRFVHETEFNSISNLYTKGTIVVSRNDRRYHYNKRINGKLCLVYISPDYYNECILQDRFYLVRQNKDNEQVFEVDYKLTNTVSYKMNLIDSEDAIAIKLPENEILQGDLIFEIDEPNCLARRPQEDAKNYWCIAFHISDFMLKYTNSKDTYDLFNKSEFDSDVVYSNVINDNNVMEMDDIELLINSNAKNISAYSNCATKSGGKFDYLKTVYSPLHDKNVLPEQMLIDKLYSHYKAPKFRYSNNLNRGFSILSRIYENSLKKEMVVDQMSIDYANESCNVSLIEV